MNAGTYNLYRHGIVAYCFTCMVASIVYDSRRLKQRIVDSDIVRHHTI